MGAEESPGQTSRQEAGGTYATGRQEAGGTYATGRQEADPADGGGTDEAQAHDRGYLPHWERAGATYFVTFRLADALPKHVLDKLMADHRLMRTQQASAEERRRADQSIQRYLDVGKGSCYLAQPRIAELVAGALRHFDGARYLLLCWCIMPNHVHVVFQPRTGYELSSILHTWKSWTAKHACALLGIPGPFWQHEYYDHLVRSEQSLLRIIAYIQNNPIKADLEEWPWVEAYDERIGTL